MAGWGRKSLRRFNLRPKAMFRGQPRLATAAAANNRNNRHYCHRTTHREIQERPQRRSRRPVYLVAGHHCAARFGPDADWAVELVPPPQAKP